MLHGIVLAACGDRGVGIRPAVGVDQEGVTFSIVFAIFEMLGHVDLATVGGASFTD